MKVLLFLAVMAGGFFGLMRMTRIFCDKYRHHLIDGCPMAPTKMAAFAGEFLILFFFLIVYLVIVALTSNFLLDPSVALH